MIDQETQALYDILLDAGAVKEQLDEALEERERSGKDFRDVVLDFGFCNDVELMNLIADNLGTEVVDLLQIDIPTATLDIVDPETARAYGVVAIRVENDLLYLAMRHPLDTAAVDDLLFTMNVGNGPFSGGGIKQNPAADPTDGVFHTMFVKTPTFRQIIEAIPKLYNGRLTELPFVYPICGKEIEIAYRKHILFEADGILENIIGPCKVTCIHHALQFRC